MAGPLTPLARRSLWRALRRGLTTPVCWTLARYALTGAFLFLVARSLDLNQLGASFGRLHLAPLALAALVAVGATVAAGIAWKVLLEGMGVKLPWQQLARIHLVGFFFAQFSPGGLAGDVSRVYQLHREANRKVEALASALATRMVSALTLLALAGVFSLLVLPGLPSSWVALELLAAAGLAVLALGIFNRRLQGMARRLPSKGFIQVAVQVLAHSGALMLRRRCLVAAFLMYLAHHLLVVLLVYLVMSAIDAVVPFLWLLALVPLARVLVLLPISVGGIGVQEGAFALLLAQVGVAPAAAVSASLLTHLVMLPVPLSGGLLFMLGRGKSVSTTPSK